MNKKHIKNIPDGYHMMANGELMKNQDMMKSSSWRDYIPLMFVFGYIFLGSFLLTCYFVPGRIELLNENFGFEWMVNLVGMYNMQLATIELTIISMALSFIEVTIATLIDKQVIIVDNMIYVTNHFPFYKPGSKPLR